MGPSSQAVEAVTKFCDVLPTSHFRSVSEGETVKHGNMSLRQHRNCGNNVEEEKDEVAETQ